MACRWWCRRAPAGTLATFGVEPDGDFVASGELSVQRGGSIVERIPLTHADLVPDGKTVALEAGTIYAARVRVDFLSSEPVQATVFAVAAPHCERWTRTYEGTARQWRECMLVVSGAPES